MTKFAYFGTPYVARDTLAALVEAGYSPAVVITSPDALRGRGLTLTASETKAWALEHDMPVLTPEKLDEAFIKDLEAYGCEFGIAVAYGKILPQALIDLFPKGILNVHYSLLPKYRGASPVEAALWNGDEVTGVTVQQMAFKLDAGDILAQRKMPIEPADTTLTLRPKLISAGVELLIETLHAFMDGSVTRMSQDEAHATHAPKIRKEQGLLTLSADPYKDWLTYRALRESPGTYFFAEKVGEAAGKADKRIRVKIADAQYENGEFKIRRIIPEGKPEQDFSWLTQAGYQPVKS